ncbi:MAG: histidine kinase dimerization/phosphoacceptor domain -containing protein [Bacteroidota bacterium]
MRIILLIILLVTLTQLRSQPSDGTYLGQLSWQKVPGQKKPEALIYKTDNYPIKKITYTDNSDTFFSKKVNPGTILIKKGPTLPVSEGLKITGKKITAPQVIQAPPLQIRDEIGFNINYTDKKHGFPALNAYDFAEDDEHNIWITTEKGVLSYDGYFYHYYLQPDDMPGLDKSFVLFDHQQRLWVATNHGLYFFKNDSVFNIQHSSIDFSSVDCEEIIIDQFKRIWIPTKSYGAICIDGNTVKVYDKRCGLRNNFVEAMMVDKKGNLWLASRENGVVLIEPDQMRMFFSNTKSMSYHNFLSFYEDHNGVWAGSYLSGLFRFGPTDTLQFSAEGRFNEVVLDIKKAPAGGIWVSFYGHALVYLSGNKILRLNHTNGLLNRLPMRLFVDSFENVWVSNIEGFSRVNDNSFYLGRFSHPVINHMNTIITDTIRKGKWMVSFGSTLLFKKGNKTISHTYRSPTGITPFAYLNGGTLNKDGSFWIGTYGEGFALVTENKFIRYTYSALIDHHVVLSVKTDNTDKVWFCPKRFGLIMYDKKKFWHYTKQSGLLSNNALNLFVDADKTVYWTFVQGVQRYKDETLETFYINNRPFNDKINQMIELDKNRVLWGTENSGLLLIEGEKVFQFTGKNGLASNTIKLLIKDAYGKVWITTNRGIESFNLTQHSLTNHTIYNQSNGSYLLDVLQVHLDTNGLPYWVIGDKKLIYDTAFIRKNTRPILNFRQIILNNQTKKATTHIAILPNQKATITYKTIFWGMENNLQLSYLLVSQKNDTTERPIQNTDRILISDILPGKYKVLLKAVNNNKTYYSTAINLTVNNFWYNTWTFRITMGAIILMSIIFYYRRKSKAQLRINDELQRKVQEQTKEIEKEKEALLASYQTIDLQNKEKDVLIDEINHRVKNNLQFILAILEMQAGKQYSREALEALLGTSRRINAMSLVHELLYTKKDNTGLSIKSYIYELVDNLKEMADANVEPVNIELDIDPIIMDSKKALAIGMIVSELVSNSYKHAFNNTRKPKISISLKKEPDKKRITLTVQDNGRGYSSSENSGSGLGRRLVDIFSRQLEGNYELSTEDSFSYTLHINHL